MKLQYYPETDSLYIDLVDRPSADSHEAVVGIVLDFDSDRNLVGIEIDRASQRVDLSRIETERLPVASRIAGTLEWGEDAVAYQRRIREEWSR